MFPEEVSTSSPDLLINIGILAGVVILGALVILLLAGVYRISAKGREIEVQSAQQERDFEAQLIAELEAAKVVPNGPIEPPLVAAPLSARGSSPAPPPAPSVAPPAQAVTGPVGPEEVARRLYGLRILTEREGRIPLMLPPDGLIYRMKRGGVAAILPRMESPEAMGHLAKRFDLVFAELPDGEVLVVERLQARLPTLMDDFGKVG
jgi:hypothetical protein